MTPNGREEAIRWLQEAEEDMAAAELMANTRHFNLACFLSQQASEKVLKGFLYAQEVEEPWGHSIDRLLNEAATFDATLNEFCPLGAVLDKFYIPTRYPNGLPGGLPSKAYTLREAQDAMGMANTIIKAISQRIGNKP